MITVKTIDDEVVLKPTIFPDGTSQIWKLPKEILARKDIKIIWNFENEREAIDIFSLGSLLRKTEPHVSLFMPYLPYGRQDKEVSNDATFNLRMFAELINAIGFDDVITLDAHNTNAFLSLFSNAKNIYPSRFHYHTIEDFCPTYVVFPDDGARNRYSSSLSHIRTINCDKIRDQATGNIIDIEIDTVGMQIEENARLLIVDDICDGGATFIGVADSIRENQPKCTIALAVTHGIFSKGRQHLLDNGIDKIYTTNSLLKNEDGYGV